MFTRARSSADWLFIPCALLATSVFGVLFGLYFRGEEPDASTVGVIFFGLTMGLLVGLPGGALLANFLRKDPRVVKRAKAKAANRAKWEAAKSAREKAREDLHAAAERYYEAAGQNPLAAAVSAANLLDRA